MSAATSSFPSSKDPSNAAARLQRVRAWLVEQGLDALVVRSTDRYLNEYVPDVESTRQWLTGFTGSMGDALVTLTDAYLAVDGRYHQQAEEEVTSAWSVVKLPQTEPVFMGLLSVVGNLVKAQKLKGLALETQRFTVNEKEHVDRLLANSGVRVVGFEPSPLETLRGPVASSPGRLRVLDEVRVGRSSADKVAAVQKALEEAGIDVLLVEKLDDLAYLTNLRGDELPYQATFKGMGAVGRAGAVVCLHTREATPELKAARPAFRFVTEQEFAAALTGISGTGRKAAIDGAASTEATRLMLTRAGFTPAAMGSPLTEMKARKTPEELACMVEAFHKADRVVTRAQAWLNENVDRGTRVSEADFAARVAELFTQSGAVGLSFKVISAAGANGAIIHYSNPSPQRFIEKGELMLLDTGAYYEEGYATDLTRTFLVGGAGTHAGAEQKRLYTLTLKAAIAGMTAVVPVGAPGISLDAITRKPLWDAGLNYNHGTGHGVGINVHEAPPSISMRSMMPLGVGYVFSIEPGVYIPGWGGIRIENLCTLEEHAQHKGFLRVKPLTFSPLDGRLVDHALLNAGEEAFLKFFNEAAAVVV
jgi:Xaa-Pro aminopeptidase